MEAVTVTETERQTPQEVTATQQTLPTPPISPTLAEAEISGPVMRQPSSTLLSADVNITNTILPGIDSLTHRIAIPLSFRRNLTRSHTPLEVGFDSSSVTSTQWSPILQRHPNLQREQRRESYIAHDHTSVSNTSSSSSDSDVNEDGNIQATPLADSVNEAAALSTISAINSLPPQLRADANLAEKVMHAVAARIAFLRLLLLDVDGTPIVPFTHLQTQFAVATATVPPVLYTDHAGEFTSLILRRLIASFSKRQAATSEQPDENLSLRDDDGSSDGGETDSNFLEFLPLAGMGSLWRRAGQSRLGISSDSNNELDADASEIGADTQRRRIFSETAPECQCEPCTIESTLNAPFAYLLRTTANYNEDPVKMAFYEALCGSEGMKKKDYWRRETRRMSAWESRFREFAHVHRGCVDGVGGGNCRGGSSRHHHEVWCGYTGYTRRWGVRPIQLDWSESGGDDDDDSDSDGSDELSDESDHNPERFAVNELNEEEDEDEDDENNDEDDDDDENGSEEDGDEEHEIADETTREKLFLEDFMAKLQELFGLLEVYEKLQQIPVVSR
ncbi:hypothetical protein HK100_003966 [Physocladia obscura]|uniref:Uncharacterized protein n=1 Tax=Physocladia obscura TaxID=109957 RepID=A0AAD5STR1_9FUNG|nr:hypothetical protein HK100_003966 [Physocladia obscura]